MNLKLKLNRKHWGLAGLAVVAFTAVASVFWGVAGAQTFRMGNSTVVGQGEVVNSTLWISGRNVDIAGTVNGDVFCAGVTVNVSGTVRGDVICAGQNVTISGRVDGDIRVAGQNVSVGATNVIGLTAAAQSFVLEGRGEVRRDISVAGSDVSLHGSIGRDAAVTGQEVTFGGEVGRDAKATANNLHLNRNADIDGDLSYTSQNDADIAGGAVVRGETIKYTPAPSDGGDGWMNFGLGFGTALYLIIAGLLVALVLILLFPQAIHAATSQAIRSPLKTLLVGAVAAVLVPVAIFLLAVTLIGIPLALLLLVAWILVCSLAGVLSAYLLGRLILRRQRNSVIIMLLGAPLLIILYFIPVIGFIVWLAAMLFGKGMLLLELYDRRAAPRYRVERP